MLVSLLAAVIAQASPAPAGPPATSTIEAALVRGDDPLLAEVERALRVRLPSLALVRQGSDLPEGSGLRAFVELRRTSPTQVEVAVILSDGRAYFRAVDTEPDAPARPVAGALALLIAAIEDDSVAPDQRDVPVPPAIVAAPVEPVPEARAPACPAAPPCPQPQPAAPEPPPPRVELAPVLRSGATLGLGPAVPGIRGAMFGLGLDVRWRGGAIVAAEVQAIAATVEGLPLSRGRMAVGAGYGLRRGAFELPIVAMVGVERWGLPGDGTVSRRGADGPIRPLVGGGLRLSPGVRARVGSAWLRFGGRVELWGSGEPGPGGLRQPVLVRPGERPAAALGGAELSLGLELAVWLAPRGHKAKQTGPKRQGR